MLASKKPYKCLLIAGFVQQNDLTELRGGKKIQGLVLVTLSA